jgi:phosphoribosyl-ATP pyrophosphohydrolase
LAGVLLALDALAQSERLTFGHAPRLVRGMAATLITLESTIRDRRGADPTSSYVASLFTKGRAKIAQKLGEEAVETVIAAMQGDREETTKEAADLLFHLIVLLADMDIPLANVLAELDAREGVSGLAEKAARAPS